jgi:hypothetical protein
MMGFLSDVCSLELLKLSPSPDLLRDIEYRLVLPFKISPLGGYILRIQPRFHMAKFEPPGLGP